MARVLREDGHSIILLTPDGAGVAGYQTATLTPQSLRDCSARADVAVVQGHVANELWAHGSVIPTVVDLYDPFIVENLHYYTTRGSEVFAHDHQTLMASLRRGDLFLCASSSQRFFYLGMLLAAGRLNPISFESDPTLQSLLRLAPFGVSPAIHRTGAEPDRTAVLFGGIYDWYDPILAIDAVVLARREISDLSITFTTHPNPSSTPQSRTAQAIAHADRHGYGQFVHFRPWVPYEARAEFYADFSVALLTFSPSLETDLSMRTRVYDYLWAGLPVVTSSAPGTDEIIERYRAGSVVSGGSASTFAEALVRTIADRQSTQPGLREFVRDHQWEKTLSPLVEFVRSPRMDPTKRTFATASSLPKQAASVLHRLRRRMGGRS